MPVYITWGELGIWLLIFLIPYYICCVLLFYWQKLKSIKSTQAGTIWKRSTIKTELTEERDDHSLFKEDSVHTQIHELMNEIKKVFEATISDSLNKEQILEALRHRLSKYSAVKNSSFQDDVNNHIVLELQSCCGIFLGLEEVRKMW